MGKHQCTACKRTFRTAQGLGLHFNHARKNPKVCDGQPRIDPRDADLARLKAEVERLTAGQHRCEWCAETFPLVPRQMSEPAVDRGVCPQCKVERFRRDLAAHKRALAAGPAALRAKYAGYKGGIVKGAYDQSADLVERAQADAMKEEP